MRNSAFPGDFNVAVPGLTKRELFAAMAMQGLIIDVGVLFDPSKVAVKSIEAADALLKKLEATEGGDSENNG